jgi:hypothetical protein
MKNFKKRKIIIGDTWRIKQYLKKQKIKKEIKFWCIFTLLSILGFILFCGAYSLGLAI